MQYKCIIFKITTMHFVDQWNTWRTWRESSSW